MQWRMVGRRGRGRDLDRRRRPRAVVVAAPRRGRARPARSRSSVTRAGRPRAGRPAAPLPPGHQLPQQRGDLPLRGGVRRAGRPLRRPARRRPHAPGSTRSRSTVDVLEDGVREAVGELLGGSTGTVGVVVPAARRAEVAGWVALVAGGRGGPVGGDDARLVVLTGLDTKGLEFDGIVVVAARRDRARSRSTGRATLYVVLTRATQRLVTRHRRLTRAGMHDTTRAGAHTAPASSSRCNPPDVPPVPASRHPAPARSSPVPPCCPPGRGSPARLRSPDGPPGTRLNYAGVPGLAAKGSMSGCSLGPSGPGSVGT